MPFLIAAIVAIVALAHTAPFPFVLEAFHPSRSLWHVDAAPGTPPTIYFTFDDGPNPDWTPALLDALHDTGVRATFFLIDQHITSETAPIVARIGREGHAIGLHSGSRRPVVSSPDAVARMLDAAAAHIEAITGHPPCRLFRPHAGWRSATLYDGLGRAGYTLTGWSWGMWDWDWWRRRRADTLAPRLAGRASAGDIIVIHDSHHKNQRADRAYAVETIRELVPDLRQKGFSFDGLCGS